MVLCLQRVDFGKKVFPRHFASFKGMDWNSFSSAYLKSVGLGSTGILPLMSKICWSELFESFHLFPELPFVDFTTYVKSKGSLFSSLFWGLDGSGPIQIWSVRSVVLP